MSDFKDDILVELLGCGYADLSVLEDCKYDFSDVIDECKMQFGDLTLNNLARTMFEFGINDIKTAINERIEEIEDEAECEEQLSEELREELHALRDLDAYEDIESFHNFLDTSIYFVRSAEVYHKYLEDALDEFAENTGYSIGG